MNDLFVIESLQNKGLKHVELTTIVKRFSNQRLVIPVYQRDFVWKPPQIKSWVEAIIQKDYLGTIVTYQLLEDNSPIYLEDGLQRLTATMRFINNPETYGFKFGTEQAFSYCEQHEIGVAHLHYKTHQDAMNNFQGLNSGTGLIPAEIYKGELTLTEVGNILSEKIPSILDRYETNLLKNSRERNLRAKRDRDSYGLFLQYISETDVKSFWNTSTSIAKSDKKIVERELMTYIRENNYSIETIEAKLIDFESFIASHYVTIRTLLQELNLTGKAISPTTARWILHLNLYRKNTGTPSNKYEQIIKYLFEILGKFSTLPSRFFLPDTSFQDMITLNQDSLKSLNQICIAAKVPDFIDYKRKKQTPLQPGYDNSHLKPVSLFGENETFPEPSQRNRARGAREVEIP